ncbi:hypothetical protein Q8A73_005646 [Channa argus]|nr:hypothetical protein Q8A73_005646 [Channa argus]
MVTGGLSVYNSKYLVHAPTLPRSLRRALLCVHSHTAGIKAFASTQARQEDECKFKGTIAGFDRPTEEDTIIKNASRRGDEKPTATITARLFGAIALLIAPDSCVRQISSQHLSIINIVIYNVSTSGGEQE